VALLAWTTDRPSLGGGAIFGGWDREEQKVFALAFDVSENRLAAYSGATSEQAAANAEG
jgi:hypothetical protein